MDRIVRNHYWKENNLHLLRGVPKMLGPQAKFAQHGQSGAWISENLPHLINGSR